MSLVAYNSSSDESEEENKNVKKQKESVKITIPSLKEFEDIDDEPVAKKKKFQSGSGLFSLLPPPKNVPSAEKSEFVPHILSKKAKSLTPLEKKKNTTSASTLLKNTTSSTSEIVFSEEQESDDEDISLKDNSKTHGVCDFFWLDDLASKNEAKVDDNISVLTKNTTIQDLPSQLPCSSTNTVHQIYFNEVKEDEYVQQHQQMPFVDVPQLDENINRNSSNELKQLEDGNLNSNDSSEKFLLNDKEFLKLKGRKHELQNIDIIDVKADDHLTNKNEWLKNLTEEMTYRPSRKHGLPTQQQKRKHQITYLAFQAKEREMDLKNQWSLNRRTRRETQSKYGF